MPVKPLTEDERRLLAILVTGATDEAAALRLGLSSRTVRRRLRGVMDKLGASSRFQAGYLAGVEGVIERPDSRGAGRFRSGGSSTSLWFIDGG